MTNITVNVDAETVDVSPGNRWVDVYGALDPFGLYTIGGRMKTIGVAGLTLIGGFHYLINKYGYAMDGVTNYEVVLGNGTQISANNVTNPDLFWALKGGASNFGVITKFTFKTVGLIPSHDIGPRDGGSLSSLVLFR
jgi:FAD/FMN-containing dehydrogenase